MAAPVVPGQEIRSNDTSTHWNMSRREVLVSVGVGIASFAASELMRYLLIADIGRRRERLLAEGVTALVVALLTARLLYVANQRREAALLRLQVISEMNHHIRNALTAISLTAESTENQPCIQVISDCVNRIEWALREILLRRKPIEESKEARLRYLEQGSESRSTSATSRKRPTERAGEGHGSQQENTNEYGQSSMRGKP